MELSRLVLAAGVFLMSRSGAENTDYTNMWIAEIRGGEDVAQKVARDLGYTYDGKADSFEDHYVFKRDDHPEISKRGSLHLTRSLTELEEVEWAEQQSVVRRTKRGIVPEPPKEPEAQAPPKGRDFWSDFDNDPFFKSSFGNKNPFGSSSSFGNKPFGTSSFGTNSFGSSSFGSSPFKLPSSFNKPTTFNKPTSFNKPSLSSSPSKTASSASSTGDSSTAYTTDPMGSNNLKTYSGTTKNIGCISSKPSSYAKEFNDPLWPLQWYAQDYRTKDGPVMDLNLVPVYHMGITGKGIKIAVVDDGVQNGHPDLQANFLPELSYDMCNDKPGSDPDPPSGGHANSHGSKCAGEMAMVANNNKCGVGVAYNAKVAGVKVLGHRSVDYMEARGLIWKLNVFDIYSNSWGPADDGLTMERVGRMSSKAFEKGVLEGRNGKGSIYVFAAGNGKHAGDNCAADGLINNPHTIAISSVSQNGKTVYYSESCTAVFAGTYSSGNTNDEKVATIDLDGGCTTSFSGTSAAAPIASGIIALTLEANPSLTVRDIYHIIAMGAEVAPVADNGNIWYKNGKGFWVSNDFGFGLLNAKNMVNLAKTWTNVPAENTCIVSVELDSPQYFTVGEIADIEFDTEACQDTKGDAVIYLEQIEVASNIQYPYRGAISITITSPSGTRTTLLAPRPNDDSRDGLQDWSIKSVHNWGENPKGTWEIEVKAAAISGVKKYSGYVKDFTLTFHGTSAKPAHFDQLPRKYSAFRLPNGKTSELLRWIMEIAVRILNMITNSGEVNGTTKTVFWNDADSEPEQQTYC